jgi:hypothetical protein
MKVKSVVAGDGESLLAKQEGMGLVQVLSGVQDITVVVEHDDGTDGTYVVRSRGELLEKIRQYDQWVSELASLEGMVKDDE